MSMIDFHSPSYRQGSADLTVQVSPFGLIELSDEEFEINGPRLNRYAQAWAYYLGNHWGYMRELGESRLTFNYARAMSDYTTNFCFSKGVTYQVPQQNEAIIPAALDRIWTVDNKRKPLLWEIGQTGSVCGDVFVKIAYEEAWVDPVGNTHPGRVRILPLNPSFCLTPDTEILTKRGWLFYDQLTDQDEALSLNLESDEIVWTDVKQVNVFDWDGPLAKWENERFSVLSTADHRWIHESGRGKRSIKRTHELHDKRGGGSGRLVVAGGIPLAFAETAKWDNDFVELVAWFVTEGHWHSDTKAPCFTQSEIVNPEKAARIARLLKIYSASTYRYKGKATQWYVPMLRNTMLSVVGLDKQLTPEFLTALTYTQARLLYETLLDGDGHRGITTTFSQSNAGRVDGFQMLAAMLGLRTQTKWRQRDIGLPCSDTTVYQNRTLNMQNLRKTEEHYQGKVWCPTTGTGTWLARRKGITFWTGNCFPEWHPHDRNRMIRFKLKYRFWGTSLDGTRSVFTYTELITDYMIEEYINDELIDSHPNPLGEIPIVHIPNLIVGSSPWGMPDIPGDFLTLNRQYNETATALADIINYHAEPTTIVVGAKASQLEAGAKKVWSGLPKEAQVYNLEMMSDANLVREFLVCLKQAMHEMTNIPITALGQEQPVSNTSGVALQIQYQPMMMKFDQKTTNYGAGLEKINYFALKTLALKEPEMFAYDPNTSPVIKEGQWPILDRRSDITYRTHAHFQTPLPIDKLIKLNELMSKMQLGLESKRGALKELGEENPDLKMEELQDELINDAKDQGALDLLKAHIADIIMLNTFSGAAMAGGGDSAGAPASGNDVASAGGPQVNTATGTADSQEPPAAGNAAPVLPGVKIDTSGQQDLLQELSTLSKGTKLPQQRTPGGDDD